MAPTPDNLNKQLRLEQKGDGSGPESIVLALGTRCWGSGSGQNGHYFDFPTGRTTLNNMSSTDVSAHGAILSLLDLFGLAQPNLNQLKPKEGCRTLNRKLSFILAQRHERVDGQATD